ncbi:MAG TPA: phosphate signaling complex protein PhoU [Thermomicrobiales bacterium]|nr:phosphate signaling complex protein PhoU [Thermomicrobiales bacterium]
MIRHEYINDLENLRGAVVAMSSMVDKAISRSIESLIRQDVGMAEEVVAADREVNKQRWATEEDALRIIATQAPMARDLRNIAAAIHIITDLERMGDHAAGIAKIVIETASEPLLKPLVDIPRMAEVARAMLNDAITAYIEADSEAATRIAMQDDEVDALYEQIYRELLTYMLADPSTINRATHLLWVAHNLERIADRVTNICERVVFAETGELTEINVSTY